MRAKAVPFASGMQRLRLARMAALAFLLIAASPRATLAACAPEITVSPSGAALSYAPFDAAPAIADLTLRLTNTGQGVCRLGLAVFSPDFSAQGPSGGAIRYEVEASGSRLANSGSEPPGSAAGLALLPLQETGPDDALSLPLRFALTPGQMAAPGAYLDSMRLALYDLASGALAAEPLPVPISISVEPVLRLSLAGGGQGATVDFGEMADGASRVVLLRARTNVGFALTLSSENGGALLLDPPALDAQRWAMPYRVTVSGNAPVSLDRPRLLPITGAATELGGLTLPIDVTLGPSGALRAGTYRDIVTIAIDAGY